MLSCLDFFSSFPSGLLGFHPSLTDSYFSNLATQMSSCLIIVLFFSKSAHGAPSWGQIHTLKVACKVQGPSLTTPLTILLTVHSTGFVQPQWLLLFPQHSTRRPLSASPPSSKATLSSTPLAVSTHTSQHFLSLLLCLIFYYHTRTVVLYMSGLFSVFSPGM